MSQQKGFLLVAAVILIVAFALLSAALVSTVFRTTESTLYLQSIPAAGALAESGLDQAKKNMTLTNLGTRQTCVGLASSVNLTTGKSLSGLGSNTTNNPRHAYATLSTAIANNTTPTTITVNDSSVFAPNGWVLIGREMFQYDRIANATTLAGVSRAQDGTEASIHVTGVLVSQYQCLIAGVGHVPAANPKGIREYQQGMHQPILFTAGNTGTILRWNGPTSELLWAAENSGTAQNLHAISALNYHSAWAVGDRTSAGFMFSRLQGNVWTAFFAPLGSETNLYGVDAVSEREAWAVGERTGGNVITILRWERNATNDSSNWCRLPCAGKTLTSPGVQPIQKSVYGLKMLDLNGDGFADVGFGVGGSHDQSSKEGVVWYYSGTGWSPIDKAPLNYAFPADISRLVGVDITRDGSNAPKEVFFAGRSGGSSGGKLLRLRIVSGAAVWVIVDTTEDLEAVSIVDTNGDGFADFGCAVGNNGTVITFDSNMATTVTTLPTGNNTLRSVFVLSPSDIWVVGDNGIRFHYNGTTWVSLTNNVTTGVALNGLSGVFHPSTGLGRWHEFIH
ncbi:MAG: hypothetical protein QNK11_01755 [Legionella sp.]|nr:hypothetical protein [Legionella sp.]